MKNYKKLLIPSIYIGVVLFMVISTTIIVNGIKSYVNGGVNFNYTLDGVFDDDIKPVMGSNVDAIIRPYISENVKIWKTFYDYESDEKNQENSIISFENTYLQNTGVDYSCNEEFDIVAVLDGEVIGIEENEIYGNIITIKHNDNLITRYANVDNILINVGYKTSQGEIIATSSPSKIDANIKSSLHFEVEYKGDLMDPEKLYTLKVSDLE